MYIQVRLLQGYQQPLWYQIPDSITEPIAIDSIVQVPLRNQTLPAIVQRIQRIKPAVSFEIKAVDQLMPFPADKHYSSFIKKLGEYHQLDPIYFIKRIAQFIQEQPSLDTLAIASTRDDREEALGRKPEEAVGVDRASGGGNSGNSEEKAQNTGHTSNIKLTQEQQQVTDFLRSALDAPAYTPTVLHGVTGSGKTEVYKELIAHAYNHGKTTLLLLPEVTLARAFEKRLRAELALLNSQIPLYSFHSATTVKEKKAAWQKLLSDQPMLIIGVHLPVLLPIPNLGLIIVDEEHEVGYQEKKHPKINSKDAAIMRAHSSGIPILLGSATPSLTTLYNVQKRGWHFFQLKNRFAGAFPTVQTVSLADKKDRKQFWISQQLYDAIKDRLQKKEQAIIFLNRRGYSFFVQCKECSFIFSCDTCSVSLTLHAQESRDILSCHYCGFSQTQPSCCPSCKKSEFIKKGIGTQQVVTILEKLFPAARIARADMDTTTKKKAWEQTMEQFVHGDIDILVGTQTITKGYDFPGVTLVGVLWADLNLHFPIFNAAETTLQQIIQVAGRAGRHSAESLVIVQTMTDHAIFDYLNEIDYPSFYQAELDTREFLGYPPCKRLVEIELKSSDEIAIEREAHDLVHALRAAQELCAQFYAQQSSEQNSAQQRDQYLNMQILGPARPPVHKIKSTHMRKIYIKGEQIAHILAIIKKVDTSKYSSSIYFVPNPVS
jgi:primosomal protein N' (replication factor Y)